MDLSRAVAGLVSVILFGGLHGAVWAQAFEQRVDPFPVRDSLGIPYEFPFLGGLNTPRPQLVDLDADGDLDLFLQERRNRLIYFENTGSCDAPSLERAADAYPPSDPVQTSGYNVPALADLDGNGALDLLVGVLGGSGSGSSTVENLLHLENEGTPKAPDFTLEPDTYDQIQANAARTHPAFADRDGDGAQDLYLGTTQGIAVYKNAGTAQSASFETAPDSLALPLRPLAAPVLADVNGDDRPDLMAGGEGGGVKFFAGRDESAGPSLPPEAGVRTAPNPFVEQTTLPFALDEAASVSLAVYDVLGRRVSVLVDRSLGPGDHTAQFRGTERASGVYFYILSVDGRVRDRGRIILVR